MVNRGHNNAGGPVGRGGGSNRGGWVGADDLGGGGDCAVGGGGNRGRVLDHAGGRVAFDAGSRVANDAGRVGGDAGGRVADNAGGGAAAVVGGLTGDVETVGQLVDRRVRVQSEVEAVGLEVGARNGVPQELSCGTIDASYTTRLAHHCDSARGGRTNQQRRLPC